MVHRSKRQVLSGDIQALNQAGWNIEYDGAVRKRLCPAGYRIVLVKRIDEVGETREQALAHAVKTALGRD